MNVTFYKKLFSYNKNSSININPIFMINVAKLYKFFIFLTGN